MSDMKYCMKRFIRLYASRLEEDNPVPDTVELVDDPIVSNYYYSDLPLALRDLVQASITFALNMGVDEDKINVRIYTDGKTFSASAGVAFEDITLRVEKNGRALEGQRGYLIIATIEKTQRETQDFYDLSKLAVY